MTSLSAEHFASHFCLTLTPEDKDRLSGRFTPDANSKTAAVLVPIVKRPHGLNILFTQRALHLRHHPGQISFPGGRQDESDVSLVATALRETEEEIGVNSQFITPLGWLPSHHTISNYTIYPLVALIENGHTTTANEDEVAEIFEVPLAHFLHREAHYTVHPSWHQQRHTVHFMPYQDKLIWGATAAILDKLASHFE